EDALLAIPLPFIENDLATQFPAAFFNLEKRHNFLRVHDRHVKARLNCIVEKHGIEHVPDMGGQSERDITNAEESLCFWKFFFNETDSLDRFNAGFAEFLIAAAERERERVKNNVAWLHSEFADG